MRNLLCCGTLERLNGSVIVKHVPSPGVLSTTICPFMASVNDLTSVKPMPVPPFSALR